jgi:predicted ribosomally synthesized peptide with SipW-like signal peptide
MPNDDRLQLTRRKLLAGTTAVGAAGIGAGLGTSALFSDEESFEDNIVAAGELNMQVAAHVRDQNEPLPQVQIDSDSTPQDTADGNTVTITASDVKPGDWFIIQWDISVCTNPAHVQVTSVDEAYVNDEGTNTEPETDTASPGDLGGALLTSVWHSYSPVGNTDTRPDLGDLDPTTDQNDTWLPAYERPDIDGVTSSGAEYTTMDEAHDQAYSDGVILRDRESEAPLEVGCVGDDEDVSYWQLFEVPSDVGNAIQGDVVEFTLRFNAQQARNNDDPFSA